MRYTPSSLWLGRASIATSVALTLHASHAVAHSGFPDQVNCQLRSPPSNALTVPTHGVDYLLYPGPAAISADYSGCQSVWLGDVRYPSEAHLLFRAHFERGEPTSVWIFEPEKREIRCQYSGGALVGPLPVPSVCPAPSDLPFNPQRSVRK
jgi:hypothetical protein